MRVMGCRSSAEPLTFQRRQNISAGIDWAVSEIIVSDDDGDYLARLDFLRCRRPSHCLLSVRLYSLGGLRGTPCLRRC